VVVGGGGWWEGPFGKEYVPSEEEINNAKRKKTVAYLIIVFGFITIVFAGIGINSLTK